MGGGRAQMSTNVTNEVVRMSFEGDDFEKKISKSLSALQKLKEHLKFGKVSDEVADNTSRMTAALETMANKAESVWSRVTDSIRDSIKNKIMGALREVEDMTVNQLAKGWEKYAEKTEAVATLVGQGYDMDTVNKEMAKLNRYTDETSYQFTNMVQSIGKFTAAGQSLEDANLAMQGIANWAAKSGTNASKASQAMYQLSQAMGKGVLKLDDYKSVQNLGMDTMEFKQQAVEAAVALGTLRDNLDGTYTVINEDGKAIDKMTFNLNSFTTQLTEGQWLTSDVMMKTFSRYASAIDNINDMIDNHGVSLASKAIENLEERNEALRTEFRTLEGTIDMSSEDVEKSLLKWSKVTEVTEDAVKNYMEYNEGVSEEEAKIALNKEYEKSVQEFADTFKVSSEEAKKYIHDFNGYTDQFGLDAYKMAQEAKTFKDAIDSVKDAASTQWMNVWEKLFGDYATARSVWTKFANFLYDVLVDWLNDLNDALADWVERGGRGILMETFSALGDIIWVIRDAISDIRKALFGKTNGKKLVTMTQRIHDFVFKIRDFFIELQESKFLENITNFLSGIRKTVTRLFSAIITGFTSSDVAMKPISTTIIEILEGITGFINNFRKSIAITKADVPKLTKFFTGLHKVIQVIGDIASTIFGTLFRGLFPGIGSFFDKMKEVKGGFVDFLELAGTKMEEFARAVRDSGFIDELRERLEKATEFIRTNVYPVISKFLIIIWKLIKAVGGVMLWAGGIVIDLVKKIPWDIIKEKLTQLKEVFRPLIDVVKDVGNAFKDGLGSMKDSMSDFNEDDQRTFFQRVLDALAEGFRVFKDRLNTAWTSFKDVIKEITNSTVWQKFTDFLKKAWSVIKDVFKNYIKPVLDYIWSVVSGPVKKVLEMLRQGQIKEIMDLIKSAFQINSLRRISAFFKTFTEFFKDAHLADIIRSISGTFHSISNMFNSLASTADYAKVAIKAWRNERVANTLLKIMAALAILIGMVFALSFITPERAKKMGEAFILVLSAALVIIGLLLTVGKVASKGTGSLLGVAAVFAAIAVCVAVIAHIIKIMGEQLKANTSTIVFGFLGVLAIFGLLVAAIWILVKQANKISRGFADNKLLALAAIIASLGLAVALIGTSLRKMGELDAEDFWQAIAGVTIMIAALSAATWLLNVQKSQKGTWALIALLLVIKFMLIPMLRSIAEKKFDLGQALMAVFIPLLAIAGYIFALSKMYASEKMGFKAIATAIIAFAAVMAVISYMFLPALGKAVAASQGGSMISAAISLLIMMGTVVGMFVAFGKMDWKTIGKGAAGLIIGVIAIAAALLTMSQAFANANGASGGDFALMGLGVAVALIGLAGALALIGSFATSAITGASAILILAGAIALLTQAIIAFKKYVLGESIDDTVGELTEIGTDETAGAEKKKKTINKAGKTAKSGAIKAVTKSKKQQIKDGEADAANYSEGLKKGMSSQKAKSAQNGAAEALAKNTSDGLSSYNVEEILSAAGVDSTDLYTEGLGGYDAQKILKDAGLDTVTNLDEGLSGTEAQKLLEEAGYGDVLNLTEGLEGTKATNEVEDSADKITGALTGSNGLTSDTVQELLGSTGVDLTEYLTGGLTGTDAASLLTGTDGASGDITGLLTGVTGLGSKTSLDDMATSGSSLVQSLCGGMTSTSLVGGFISGAAGSLIGQLKTAINTKLVDLAESIFTLPAWVHDLLFGTDTFDTGKAEAEEATNRANAAKRVNEYYDDFKADIAALQEYNQDQLKELEKIKDELTDEEYQEYYNEILWQFKKGLETLVAQYGIVDEYEWDIIGDWADAEVKAKEEAEAKLRALHDEDYRIEEKINNLTAAAERGELTEGNLEWLDVFKTYYDSYRDYLLDTGDLSVKYEDIIDSIVNANRKMNELFGDESKDMKGLTGKTIEELIKEYKTNGTVMFDMGKNTASNVIDGMVKEFDDEAGKGGDALFNGVDKSVKKDKCFAINSPSKWAIELAQFILEGFAEGIIEYLNLIDDPLAQLQDKFTNAITNMLINVQSLLDQSDLELTITPVIDMDNLEYIIGGMRYDKGGNPLGATSYNLSQDVSKANRSNNNPTATQENGVNPLGYKIDELISAVKDIEPTTVTVNNTVGVDTIIDKINRKNKQYGRNVLSYP